MLYFAGWWLANVASMGLEDVTTSASAITSLREALTVALDQRDAAIRQAFTDGWPIGAIAQAAGLTPARISSLLGHPFERVGRPSKPLAGPATTDD